jgi:ankyrin repeat protein
MILKKQYFYCSINPQTVMKKTLCILAILLVISPVLFAQKLLEAVESKNYTLVEQYIKEGENVNKPNKKGQFPLWVATWNSDAQMVATLLKNGADAKQKFKGKDGDIACLEIAAQEGSLEIVQLLADAGVNLDERFYAGQTALRIASRNGRVDIVGYLISKGCEVDTQGRDGATPLEAAASKGHLEIVQLLAEKGANVNIQDKEGDFALGEAAKHGFIEVVNYLLSKGADTTLKNDKGNTAEDLAKLAGQAKIETLLKKKK